MHPLSVFPQLLFLGLLAPLLLRVVVGVFMISLGIDRYGKDYNWLAIVYLVSGLLLVVGFYTQIAVIVSLFLLIFDFYSEKEKNIQSKDKKILYVVSSVILLSLLFTGPGFLAFDLPL